MGWRWPVSAFRMHASAPAAMAAVASLALAGCEAGPGIEVGLMVTVAVSGATHPTAAVDPSTGTSYVVWVGGDGDSYDVYLASAMRGGEFGPPVRVNDLPGDAAPHEQAPAQVAVGPEGNVYVLWQNNYRVEGRRFAASDLRLAVSRDGGRTFAPAVFVNDDAGELPSSHTFHDIAIGADATVYVSWIDSRARDHARAAMIGKHGHEGHGMGEGAHDLPGSEIRIAASRDGGRSFGASAVVDFDSCPCCRTSIAAGPDGTVYVAWRKIYPGEVRDIVVARSAPGTLEFGESRAVHRDGWVFPGCPHAGPSLSIGGDGGLHAAWYTGEDERQGLWHTASYDGGRTFGGSTALQTAAWVPPSIVRLASADAFLLAAWDDRREDQARVRVAAIVADREPRVIATGSGIAPSIAWGGDAGLVAWLDGERVAVMRMEARRLE
jgi:hypothetical protein